MRRSRQDNLPVLDDTSLVPEVRSVLDHLLGSLDAIAPDLIKATHLTGSIALGDFQPGKSDIDLVLVHHDRADSGTILAVLEPILANLRQTHPRPLIDGIVLSDEDLRAGPDIIDGPRVNIMESVPEIGSRGGNRNPVMWKTLHQCGIAWSGHALDRGTIWQDPARLDHWTRENLMDYWRPWLARSDRLLSLAGIASLREESIAWGVLGVTRLHVTIATGDVTSKTSAGQYALDTLPPQWHPIIREALRIRRMLSDRSYYYSPLSRRGDMRKFVDMVIEEALTVPEPRFG